MWKTLITILCASGTVLAYREPQSVNVPFRNRTRNERPNRLKIWTCPDGFVRLKKNCFYLSAGTANFQEAHFYCEDRNATLATLPKKHMDRQLREYLSRPDNKPLERWIGVRYNSGTFYWEWGIIGEKISYDGFSKFESGKERQEWHCAAMNPKRKYRWASRICTDNLHYVCHVPATKTGRMRSPGQRPRRIRPNRNRNGTLTRNLTDRNDIVPYSQGRLRTTKRSRPMWANGKRVGIYGPIPRTNWAPGAQYSDRLAFVKGKGANEPDLWMSRSKVKMMSENHLDSEPFKELKDKNTESLRTGPRTLSARTDISGQMDPLNINEEILFKN